eukprot:gene2282-8555_t
MRPADLVRALSSSLPANPASISSYSAMQNLREAISSYSIALEYLERYYMLIAFSSYLGSPHFDFGNSNHVPFPKHKTTLYMLIAFSSYLGSPHFDFSNSNHVLIPKV